MNLWSVVNGISAVGKGIWAGEKWIWNKIVVPVVTNAVSYAFNTAFQVLDEVAALRKAIPALVKKPKSREILDSMITIASTDLLPIAAIHFANSSLQNIVRAQVQNNPSWYVPYLIASSAATDWGVSIYSFSRGTRALIRIAFVGAMAPAAFNVDSERPHLTLCEEEECTAKRRFKGNVKEPMMFLAEDVGITAIRSIPEYGPYIAWVLSMAVTGSFVARAATPELCEKHKLEFVKLEALVTLGLTYELAMHFIDQALEATVGQLPFLQHRALRQMLMLFWINLASHMTLPKVKPEDATLPFNPLNAFESLFRFFTDVIYSGLVIQLPRYIKFDLNAKPLFTAVDVLNFMKRTIVEEVESNQPVLAIEGNKEEHNSKTHALYYVLKSVVTLPAQFIAFIVLPPIRSTQTFVKDKVIIQYWPAIQTAALDYLDTFLKWKGSVQYLATAKRTVALALYTVIGVPRVATEEVLGVIELNEFWRLAIAFKDWFRRHYVIDVPLADEKPDTVLHGEKQMVPAPKAGTYQEVMPEDELKLVPVEDPPEVIDAEKLQKVRSRASSFEDNMFGFFVEKKAESPKVSQLPKVEESDSFEEFDEFHSFESVSPGMSRVVNE